MRKINSIEWDTEQSVLIKAMRFPLIVLVVFAHSLAFSLPDVTGSTPGWNTYHFVSEMVSHNFARLAVCWFFTISGYFFFRYLEEGQFGFSWVTQKWKKRIRSLLIPYLIWNLGFVAMTLLKTRVMTLLGIGNDGGITYVKETGLLFWLWTGPINFPLYFVRDLMVMSLIAPLLYYLFRGLKLNGSFALLLVIFVCYTFTDWIPEIPGLGFRSVVFFSLGALLGIYKINMLKVCQTVKWSAALVAGILLVLATRFNSSAYHKILLQLFYPFGMILFMNVCYVLTRKESIREALIKLSRFVFFIFAAHEVFILGWTKGAFLRIFGDGLAGSWISYFGVPIVVLSVCMLLYKMLEWMMPKTLAFVCGGRSEKK